MELGDAERQRAGGKEGEMTLNLTFLREFERSDRQRRRAQLNAGSPMRRGAFKRERDTGKRERWKREEETLSKCVPPQRAGSETRGAVLGSEYASGTEPSQAVSIEHIAREGESCHTAPLSLSLSSSIS